MISNRSEKEMLISDFCAAQDVENKVAQQFSVLYLAVICRALQDALSRTDSLHRRSAREWIENSRGYGSLSWFCERANIADVTQIRRWYQKQLNKGKWWQPQLYLVRGHCVKHRKSKQTTSRRLHD